MAGRAVRGSVDKAPSKWGVAALLLTVVLLVRGLRGTDEPSPSATIPQAVPQAAVGAVQSEPKPVTGPTPVVMTLSQTVAQAKGDAERAIGALGGSGARLYSENCYAALARKPSTSTPDRCLAFDQIAGRLLTQAGDLFEAAWFDESQTRARYLQASSSTAEDAEGAIAEISAATSAIAPAPSASPTARSADEPATGPMIDDATVGQQVQSEPAEGSVDVNAASYATDTTERR